MNPSSQLYTATMAKLFADQGYLRKAAEIYRTLIGESPDRDDLRTALADVEARIQARPAPTRKDAELMLREWIDLLKEKKVTNRSGNSDKGGREDDQGL